MASDAVARRLAFAGIRVRTGSFAKEVEDGKLWLEPECPQREHAEPQRSGRCRGDDGYVGRHA